MHDTSEEALPEKANRRGRWYSNGLSEQSNRSGKMSLIQKASIAVPLVAGLLSGIGWTARATVGYLHDTFVPQNVYNLHRQLDSINIERNYQEFLSLHQDVKDIRACLKDRKAC